MEEEIKVNKNCVNAKIQAHILSEPEMRKIGFTDHAKDSWYFCRMLRFPKKKLYRDFEVSFSVTIPQNGNDIRIDVLDEAFLQPYDYQRILSDHPDHETALIVQEQDFSCEKRYFPYFLIIKKKRKENEHARNIEF